MVERNLAKVEVASSRLVSRSRFFWIHLKPRSKYRGFLFFGLFTLNNPLKIKTSQVCDNYLKDFAKLERERKWREDHAEFIAAHNVSMDSEGLPLDEWRSF